MKFPKYEGLLPADAENLDGYWQSPMDPNAVRSVTLLVRAANDYAELVQNSARVEYNIRTFHRGIDAALLLSGLRQAKIEAYRRLRANEVRKRKNRSFLSRWFRF